MQVELALKNSFPKDPIELHRALAEYDVKKFTPDKILNIKKGSLRKGSDADICVFDLNKPWVVKADQLKSKSKNTAIEDRKLQGKVLMTFLNGELVFNQQ